VLHSELCRIELQPRLSWYAMADRSAAGHQPSGTHVWLLLMLQVLLLRQLVQLALLLLVLQASSRSHGLLGAKASSTCCCEKDGLNSPTIIMVITIQA